VCDIEGAEGDLLHAEALSSAMIIVETHDHAVTGITDALISRFAHTHDVDVLGSIKADTALLAWLSQKEQEIALDEMRAGAEQRWLVMRPRSRRDGQRVA
jgi:hypothetical protein